MAQGFGIPDAEHLPRALLDPMLDGWPPPPAAYVRGMPRHVKRATIHGQQFEMQLLGGDTADEMIFRLGRGLAMTDLTVSDFKWAKQQFVECTKVGVVDKAVDDEGRDHGDGRTRFVALSSVYDDMFAGPDGRKLAGAFLKWAWEENFGSFFDVLRSLRSARKEALSSISPKAAAGASGDSSSPSTAG